MREDIPAFPNVEDTTLQLNHKYHLGMTLRDYFAGQALIGFINFYPYTDDEGIDNAVKKVSSLAYMLADKMLAERGKK